MMPYESQRSGFELPNNTVSATVLFGSLKKLPSCQESLEAFLRMIMQLMCQI